MNAHELAWKWEAHLPLVTDLAKQASLIRRLTAKLAKPEGYEGLKKVERDLDKLAATSCPDAELQAATQQLVAEVRACRLYPIFRLDGETNPKMTGS